MTKQLLPLTCVKWDTWMSDSI